ncbi:DUF502 domain-containing protein [Candidatus Omnitrophota bacterium]
MRIFSKIRANFLTGTLVVIPLVFTFWVMHFIIVRLDLLLLEPIVNILGRWAPPQNIEFLTRIMAFFLLLAFLALMGLATRIILLRNIFGFGEKILYKVPMISTIYKTTKEIAFAFLIQKNSIFQRAVLIEYPRKGLYQIGLVISKTKGEIQKKTKELVINVFVPTTPNPTSGLLVFVPEEDIVELDMSVAEAMKMIISGGAVVPKRHYGDPD